MQTDTPGDNFLPSEICRLVLGFLKEDGYTNTYRCFLRECEHLREYNSLLRKGKEYPTNIMGQSLLMMLNDYARLKQVQNRLNANVPGVPSTSSTPPQKTLTTKTLPQNVRSRILHRGKKNLPSRFLLGNTQKNRTVRTADSTPSRVSPNINLGTLFGNSSESSEEFDIEVGVETLPQKPQVPCTSTPAGGDSGVPLSSAISLEQTPASCVSSNVSNTSGFQSDATSHLNSRQSESQVSGLAVVSQGVNIVSKTWNRVEQTGGGVTGVERPHHGPSSKVGESSQSDIGTSASGTSFQTRAPGSLSSSCLSQSTTQIQPTNDGSSQVVEEDSGKCDHLLSKDAASKRRKKPPRRRSDTYGHEISTGGVGENPLNKIINSSRFVKTLVDNINNCLYDSQKQSPPASGKTTTTTADADSQTAAPESPSVPSTSGTAITHESILEEEFDFLNKEMTEDTVSNIINMASSDPIFDELFEIFNSDREEFIQTYSEKKDSVESSHKVVREGLHTPPLSSGAEADYPVTASMAYLTVPTTPQHPTVPLASASTSVAGPHPTTLSFSAEYIDLNSMSGFPFTCDLSEEKSAATSSSNRRILLEVSNPESSEAGKQHDESELGSSNASGEHSDQGTAEQLRSETTKPETSKSVEQHSAEPRDHDYFQRTSEPELSNDSSEASDDRDILATTQQESSKDRHYSLHETSELVSPKTTESAEGGCTTVRTSDLSNHPEPLCTPSNKISESGRTSEHCNSPEATGESSGQESSRPDCAQEKEESVLDDTSTKETDIPESFTVTTVQQEIPHTEDQEMSKVMETETCIDSTRTSCGIESEHMQVFEECVSSPKVHTERTQQSSTVARGDQSILVSKSDGAVPVTSDIVQSARMQESNSCDVSSQQIDTRSVHSDPHRTKLKSCDYVPVESECDESSVTQDTQVIVLPSSSENVEESAVQVTVMDNDCVEKPLVGGTLIHSDHNYCHVDRDKVVQDCFIDRWEDHTVSTSFSSPPNTPQISESTPISPQRSRWGRFAMSAASEEASSDGRELFDGTRHGAVLVRDDAGNRPLPVGPRGHYSPSASNRVVSESGVCLEPEATNRNQHSSLTPPGKTPQTVVVLSPKSKRSLNTLNLPTTLQYTAAEMVEKSQLAIAGPSSCSENTVFPSKLKFLHQHLETLSHSESSQTRATLSPPSEKDVALVLHSALSPVKRPSFPAVLQPSTELADVYEVSSEVPVIPPTSSAESQQNSLSEVRSSVTKSPQLLQTMQRVLEYKGTGIHPCPVSAQQLLVSVPTSHSAPTTTAVRLSSHVPTTTTVTVSNVPATVRIIVSQASTTATIAVSSHESVTTAVAVSSQSVTALFPSLRSHLQSANPYQQNLQRLISCPQETMVTPSSHGCVSSTAESLTGSKSFTISSCQSVSSMQRLQGSGNKLQGVGEKSECPVKLQRSPLDELSPSEELQVSAGRKSLVSWKNVLLPVSSSIKTHQSCVCPVIYGTSPEKSEILVSSKHHVSSDSEAALTPNLLMPHCPTKAYRSRMSLGSHQSLAEPHLPCSEQNKSSPKLTKSHAKSCKRSHTPARLSVKVSESLNSSHAKSLGRSGARKFPMKRHVSLGHPPESDEMKRITAGLLLKRALARIPRPKLSVDSSDESAAVSACSTPRKMDEPFVQEPMGEPSSLEPLHHLVLGGRQKPAPSKPDRMPAYSTTDQRNDFSDSTGSCLPSVCLSDTTPRQEDKVTAEKSDGTTDKSSGFPATPKRSQLKSRRGICKEIGHIRKSRLFTDSQNALCDKTDRPENEFDVSDHQKALQSSAFQSNEENLVQVNVDDSGGSHITDEDKRLEDPAVPGSPTSHSSPAHPDASMQCPATPQTPVTPQSKVFTYQYGGSSTPKRSSPGTPVRTPRHSRGGTPRSHHHDHQTPSHLARTPFYSPIKSPYSPGTAAVVNSLFSPRRKKLINEPIPEEVLEEISLHSDSNLSDAQTVSRPGSVCAYPVGAELEDLQSETAVNASVPTSTKNQTVHSSDRSSVHSFQEISRDTKLVMTAKLSELSRHSASNHSLPHRESSDNSEVHPTMGSSSESRETDPASGSKSGLHSDAITEENIRDTEIISTSHQSQEVSQNGESAPSGSSHRSTSSDWLKNFCIVGRVDGSSVPPQPLATKLVTEQQQGGLISVGEMIPAVDDSSRHSATICSTHVTVQPTDKEVVEKGGKVDKPELCVDNPKSRTGSQKDSSSGNIFISAGVGEETCKTNISLPILPFSVSQFLNSQIEMGELHVTMDFTTDLTLQKTPTTSPEEKTTRHPTSRKSPKKPVQHLSTQIGQFGSLSRRKDRSSRKAAARKIVTAEELEHPRKGKKIHTDSKTNSKSSIHQPRHFACISQHNSPEHEVAGQDHNAQNIPLEGFTRDTSKPRASAYKSYLKAPYKPAVKRLRETISKKPRKKKRQETGSPESDFSVHSCTSSEGSSSDDKSFSSDDYVPLSELVKRLAQGKKMKPFLTKQNSQVPEGHGDSQNDTDESYGSPDIVSVSSGFPVAHLDTIMEKGKSQTGKEVVEPSKGVTFTTADPVPKQSVIEQPALPSQKPEINLPLKKRPIGKKNLYLLRPNACLPSNRRDEENKDWTECKKLDKKASDKTDTEYFGFGEDMENEHSSLSKRSHSGSSSVEVDVCELSDENVDEESRVPQSVRKKQAIIAAKRSAKKQKGLANSKRSAKKQKGLAYSKRKCTVTHKESSKHSCLAGDRKQAMKTTEFSKESHSPNGEMAPLKGKWKTTAASSMACEKPPDNTCRTLVKGDETETPNPAARNLCPQGLAASVKSSTSFVTGPHPKGSLRPPNESTGASGVASSSTKPGHSVVPSGSSSQMMPSGVQRQPDPPGNFSGVLHPAVPSIQKFGPYRRIKPILISKTTTTPYFPQLRRSRAGTGRNMFDSSGFWDFSAPSPMTSLSEVSIGFSPQPLRPSPTLPLSSPQDGLSAASPVVVQPAASCSVITSSGNVNSKSSAECTGTELSSESRFFVSSPDGDRAVNQVPGDGTTQNSVKVSSNTADKYGTSVPAEKKPEPKKKIAKTSTSCEGHTVCEVHVDKTAHKTTKDFSKHCSDTEKKSNPREKLAKVPPSCADHCAVSEVQFDKTAHKTTKDFSDKTDITTKKNSKSKKKLAKISSPVGDRQSQAHVDSTTQIFTKDTSDKACSDVTAGKKSKKKQTKTSSHGIHSTAQKSAEHFLKYGTDITAEKKSETKGKKSKTSSSSADQHTVSGVHIDKATQKSLKDFSSKSSTDLTAEKKSDSKGKSAKISLRDDHHTVSYEQGTDSITEKKADSKEMRAEKKSDSKRKSAKTSSCADQHPVSEVDKDDIAQKSRGTKDIRHAGDKGNMDSIAGKKSSLKRKATKSSNKKGSTSSTKTTKKSTQSHVSKGKAQAATRQNRTSVQSESKLSTHTLDLIYGPVEEGEVEMTIKSASNQQACDSFETEEAVRALEDLDTSGFHQNDAAVTVNTCYGKRNKTMDKLLDKMPDNETYSDEVMMTSASTATENEASDKETPMAKISRKRKNASPQKASPKRPRKGNTHKEDIASQDNTDICFTQSAKQIQTGKTANKTVDPAPTSSFLSMPFLGEVSRGANELMSISVDPFHQQPVNIVHIQERTQRTEGASGSDEQYQSVNNVDGNGIINKYCYLLDQVEQEGSDNSQRASDTVSGVHQTSVNFEAEQVQEPAVQSYDHMNSFQSVCSTRQQLETTLQKSIVAQSMQVISDDQQQLLANSAPQSHQRLEQELEEMRIARYKSRTQKNRENKMKNGIFPSPFRSRKKKKTQEPEGCSRSRIFTPGCVVPEIQSQGPSRAPVPVDSAVLRSVLCEPRKYRAILPKNGDEVERYEPKKTSYRTILPVGGLGSTEFMATSTNAPSTSNAIVNKVSINPLEAAMLSVLPELAFYNNTEHLKQSAQVCETEQITWTPTVDTGVDVGCVESQEVIMSKRVDSVRDGDNFSDLTSPRPLIIDDTFCSGAESSPCRIKMNIVREQKLQTKEKQKKVPQEGKTNKRPGKKTKQKGTQKGKVSKQSSNKTSSSKKKAVKKLQAQLDAVCVEMDDDQMLERGKSGYAQADVHVSPRHPQQSPVSAQQMFQRMMQPSIQTVSMYENAEGSQTDCAFENEESSLDHDALTALVPVSMLPPVSSVSEDTTTSEVQALSQQHPLGLSVDSAPNLIESLQSPVKAKGQKSFSAPGLKQIVPVATSLSAIAHIDFSQSVPGPDESASKELMTETSQSTAVVTIPQTQAVAAIVQPTMLELASPFSCLVPVPSDPTASLSPSVIQIAPAAQKPVSQSLQLPSFSTPFTETLPHLPQSALVAETAAQAVEQVSSSLDLTEQKPSSGTSAQGQHCVVNETVSVLSHPVVTSQPQLQHFMPVTPGDSKSPRQEVASILVSMETIETHRKNSSDNKSSSDRIQAEENAKDKASSLARKSSGKISRLSSINIDKFLSSKVHK